MSIYEEIAKLPRQAKVIAYVYGALAELKKDHTTDLLLRQAAASGGWA